MLSVFPELLFLSPLAPFLIRVALALLFADSALKHVGRPDTTSRVLGVFEGGAAILLLVGAWTQPVAIASVIISLIWIFQPTARVSAMSTALLALVMSATLLITGAGAFAFDLPL